MCHEHAPLVTLISHGMVLSAFILQNETVREHRVYAVGWITSSDALGWELITSFVHSALVFLCSPWPAFFYELYIGIRECSSGPIIIHKVEPLLALLEGLYNIVVVLTYGHIAAAIVTIPCFRNSWTIRSIILHVADNAECPVVCEAPCHRIVWGSLDAPGRWRAFHFIEAAII